MGKGLKRLGDSFKKSINCLILKVYMNKKQMSEEDIKLNFITHYN